MKRGWMTKTTKLTNKLRAERLKLGLSGEDFARLINMPTVQLYEIERGTSVPNAILMIKIAKFLKMKVDDLFDVVE